MIRISTFLFAAILSFQAVAADVKQKLYIHSDSLQTIGGDMMPYVTFNQADSFKKDNPIIQIQVGDSLSLWIVNHDTTRHNFEVRGVNGTSLSILAGDSAHVGIRFNKQGCYIYHDPLNFPANTYLGLGGMIVVKNHSKSSFYWNVKEHQHKWNSTLITGGSVNWNNYYPRYFTINGNSNPNINLDTKARITGKVGDTLILYIANTGQSIHSMHFHGYHSKILYSSKYNKHKGRSKDTFPIYPMETLVLEIVPDKPGEYPIHDHNLVAVTGNNFYPNGMFTTILITP